MRARKTNFYSGYSRREFTPEEKEAFKLQTMENLKAFYQSTASRTLASLKNNQPKGMLPALALPYNPATGAVFKGANSWVLSQHMIENNLSDPRFVKSGQLSRLGKNIHILKGEKGIHILEPRKIQKPEPGQTSEELDGEGLSLDEQDAIFASTGDRDVIMFRPYSVFHASQINNMPPLKQSQTFELHKDKLAEQLVEACGVKLAFGADKPFYTPHNDTIHMPGKRNFEDPDTYASELLKQWYVATGAQNREGRLNGPSRLSEGLLNQAAESLRAQTFALVASQTFGLPYKLSADPIHLKCWEKQLKEDPRHIVAQTAYATNLVNAVVDFAKGVQPKADWFPDKSTWPSEPSDLDARLNEDAPQTEEQILVKRVQEIISSLDKGFALDAEQGENLQYACNLHQDALSGDAGEEDVIAAFEIRQALIEEFNGLEVNVLEEDGTVYLSIGTGPCQDQTPEIKP